MSDTESVKSVPSPPPLPPLSGPKRVSFNSVPVTISNSIHSDISTQSISSEENEEEEESNNITETSLPPSPPLSRSSSSEGEDHDPPPNAIPRAPAPPPAPPPPPPPAPPPLPGAWLSGDTERRDSVSSEHSADYSVPVDDTPGPAEDDTVGSGSEADDTDHNNLTDLAMYDNPTRRRTRHHENYDNHRLPASANNHHHREPSLTPSDSIHDDDENDETRSNQGNNDDTPEMNGAAINGGFTGDSGDGETGHAKNGTRLYPSLGQTNAREELSRDTEVSVDIDDDAVYHETVYTNKESLFFVNSPDKRIDYVLTFEDSQDEDKIAKRGRYEDNLRDEGLILEYRDKKDSVDGKTNFTLVHATWEALATGAELMNMQKKIKMPKNLQDELAGCCSNCSDPLTVGEPIIPDEDDYFTSGFNRAMIDTFDIDMNHKDDFFTNAERSLIVKEILDRTTYSEPSDSSKHIGVQRLIRSNVYKAAYPLHEGRHKARPDDEDDPWEGADKDRSRLYEAWARPGRFLCYQPLDLVRKYFGEKIAIYFAWLGFYTAMLIPASIVGLGAFIYGVVTLFTYEPVKEVCDPNGMGSTIMCPECDKRCAYWKLIDSCEYAMLTYLFDNWATVAFAAFMSLWATVFLEFWKRKQKEIEYDWDVANFELEERLRPDFEMKVRHHKQNPVTLADEPYLPWYEKVPRQCISLCIVLFFMCLVVAAIFGVIIYRIVIVVLLYSVEPNETIAKLGTSISASIVNLIIIMVLNLLYKKVAWWLTELERPRTDTEFEDGFTFKMFLFQFVNFYGSIFYIAFFKGRFSEVPGLKRNYLFGYRQDTCDPSGCLVDLFIQLAIVMVGKQFINNSKEILLPILVAFCRVKDNKKKETEKNLYMRWEQDNDLPMSGDLGLFEEYLEMVIQFGFVTIFVAAFPLAPLFALMNNVIEIRLDAYKFVKAWRRAPAAKAQDIGVWYGILESLSFIAVLSNAFIIGWTSDFIPKCYYYFYTTGDPTLAGYVNSSLSYFDLNDFDADTRPDEPGLGANLTFCRFKGYLQNPRTRPPGEMKYDYTKEHWHIFTTRLAFIIVFEHTIFLLTWIIATIIPDTPDHVKRLLLYERHLNKKSKFDHAFADKGRLKDITDNLLKRGHLNF